MTGTEGNGAGISQSATELIERLHAAAIDRGVKKADRPRKTQHKIWDRDDVELTGWKFQDWAYSKKTANLPTHARGLFTLGDKIVVRGYDKFFNVGELPTTSWASIQQNTVGPYYATLKENGCIVFLSGLEDGTLVVTSKHSTGPRGDTPDSRNHSWVAKTWVARHLADSGRTSEELARELYALNATAVGELCDDSFEEHIIPYTGDRAGIYLHGLNQNVPQFVTAPWDDISRLARKYGFHETKYHTEPTLESLRAFLDECAQTGSWESHDVEGFVVRCKRSDGSDFFFKYKFEEPYLMYRDWRELTKSYITSGGKVAPKIRRNRPATLRYLDYIKKELAGNEELQKSYLNNKGIIALRERFLEYCGQRGIDLVEAEDGTAAAASGGSSDTKYVLVPVATIGCGKTTLAVALTHLTGWGHVQNDEITSGGPRKFAQNIADILNTGTPAVFADRNNHISRLRETLFKDLNDRIESDNVRYICINFLPGGPDEAAWRLTRGRVRDRGDNHQSIRGYDDQKIDMIMRSFFKQFQPVDGSREPDALFDRIIDLEQTADTRANLVHVLGILRKEYSLVPEYSDAQIDEAMRVAFDYKPTVVKTFKLDLSYFCLSVPPEFNVADAVERLFAANPGVDASFWRKLQEDNKVQSSFHITLAHVRGKGEAEKQRFKALKALYNNCETKKKSGGPKKSGLFFVPEHKADVKLVSLAFDGKAMAIEVEIKNDTLRSSNANVHITVGTAEGVAAVAAGPMISSPFSVKVPWNIEPTELADLPLAVYFM